MKLKLDENGQVVVKDGHPVYVYEDGKEEAFDAPGAFKKISELNGEAMRHRKDKEEVQGKLKQFEGIENPEDARKALERVKSLNAGELKTTEQVEEIKREARKAAEQQVEEASRSATKIIEDLRGQLSATSGQLDTEVLGNAFANSKFLKDKVKWPASAVQKVLGSGFKRQDGKIVALDAKGEPRYSRRNPGDLANFDEALEQAVEESEYREIMLGGPGSSGSGARAGHGGSGSKTMSRGEFDRLPPDRQGEVVRGGTQVLD